MSITSTPQAAKVWCIFDQPNTVWTGRINQAFSTHDKVFEFLFDTSSGSGDLAKVREGMTTLIGTTPGGYDVGITFVRRVPTSTRFYNGETSEIAFADNLYITVLDDWAVWSDYLFMATNKTLYMKRDIVYSDQHFKFKPVPIMGTDRVARYSGSVVNLAFDGSDSYVYDSTISSYAWACSGATLTGASSATPTIHFSGTGRYVVSLTVTSAAGVSCTSYRIVFIWDENSTPTVSEVEFSSLTESYDSGGASFSASVLSTATEIRPMSKVILFAEEWYANTKISYGPVVGSENIVAIGWIENETAELTIEGGTVSFSAQTTNWWLEKAYNFVAFGMGRSTATPAKWTEMKPLTIPKACWHILMWRTTAFNCVDIYCGTNTLPATELLAQPGSIWEQLKQITTSTIMSQPCCDRYGRLFMEVETALVPAASRSGIPNRGTFSKADFESIVVNINRMRTSSQVLLSGVKTSGVKGKPFFSISRGHIPTHYGKPSTVSNLLLNTQALSNELAGNIFEKANIPYSFSLQNLLYTNRMVDIVPNQTVTLNIAAEDNARGIAYSGNAVVKNITMAFEGGAWGISWEAVPETQSVLAINGDIPRDPGTPPWVPPDYPPLPVPEDPPIDYNPDPIVIVPLGIVAILIQDAGVWVMDSINLPGVWTQVTTEDEWTWEGLDTIEDFVLSPVGVAYIVQASNIWAQDVTEVTSRVLIADDAALSVFMGSSPAIKALGYNLENPLGLVVALGVDGSILGGTYLGLATLNDAGDALLLPFHRSVGYPVTDYGLSGNFTYRTGYWFSSMFMASQNQVARYSDDLTNYDGSPPSIDLFYPGTGAFNIMNAEGTFMYAISDSRLLKLDPTDFSVDPIDVTPAVNFNPINYTVSCDPTGQYLLAVSVANIGKASLFYKSGNYGDTWTEITTIPSLSWGGVPYFYDPSLKDGRVYNMGDPLKWLIFYRATVQTTESGDHILDQLHVMYSGDFGWSWTNWAGNLPDESVFAAQGIVLGIQMA